MNDFHTDDRAQKKVRDLVLGPGFYGRYSINGRYVFIDKGRLAETLQKRFAVDTIFQHSDGRAVCVEEKIVRWPVKDKPYTAVTLETMSCTVPGHESDGWMKYGKADWLNYAMCHKDGTVVCHVIDFPALQTAFWPAVEQFPETKTTQRNRTASRIVELDWIDRQGVRRKEIPIHPTPEGVEAVKAYNTSHYRKRGTV